MKNAGSRSQSDIAGRVFIIGFDGTEMTTRLRALLTRIQPSGVIIFRRNIDTPRQTWELLRECRRAVAHPIFTCVDMEGGTVDRFRDALGTTPAAAEVFASRSSQLFQKHGRVIGDSCRALGFNVDFAPSLDLALAEAKPVMTSRVVSDNPEQVVKYARAFLRGMAAAKVLGCGKHFPGLGGAHLDTHKELPSVTRSSKQMFAEDLLPYRQLRAALPFVMVSHAAYPLVTGNRGPASLSHKWMTEILRKKIGYRGLVATDDMEMGALQEASPMTEAAVAALEAGADQLLVCHQEEMIVRAYESVVRGMEHSRRFAARVAEAARRADGVRKRLGRMARAPSAATVERLSRAVWEFSEEVRMAVLAREDAA
jgi:beta-N-acetylhexosaminidase